MEPRTLAAELGTTAERLAAVAVGSTVEHQRARGLTARARELPDGLPVGMTPADLLRLLNDTTTRLTAANPPPPHPGERDTTTEN